MSLDYRFENGMPVDKYPPVEFGDEKFMNPTTETIIFTTMVVGIGDLDEKNLPEFWARVDLYQRLKGFLVRTELGTRPIMLDDLRAHLGLHTNVFPMETRAKWLKRIAGGVMDASVLKARS